MEAASTSIAALKTNLKELFKRIKSFEDSKFEEIVLQC